MKKLIMAFLLTSAACGLFAQTPPSVSWKLSFMDRDENNILSTTRAIDMKNGDVFKIQIDFDTEAYCYVILQDPERSVVVLHHARHASGSKIELGPLLLEPPSGTDLLHVIVSAEPQQNLETKIAALTTDAGSRKAGRELMREVHNLRREISKLRENPEKPVTMGATFRKTDKQQIPGTGYSGAAVYVKPISITH